MSTSSALPHAAITAAQHLSTTVDALRFALPVTHVYNPLTYAWQAHEMYLQRFAKTQKKVVFVGMNPGPFGMVQTGVPFGEIAAVRDWMDINPPIAQPAHENPKRPIEGFACTRSEVSGRRLWGLFAQRFGDADTFFQSHFVANYCPLAFFNEGRNLTPDKLPAAEQAPLLATCDAHLHTLVTLLKPQWVIGIGSWAEARARVALADIINIKIGRVLHPSPASPAANRGWAEEASKQLAALSVWKN